MTTEIEYVIAGVLVIANAIAFAVMWYDKHLSVSSNSTDRIPEGVLFFLASCFVFFLLSYLSGNFYFLTYPEIFGMWINNKNN